MLTSIFGDCSPSSNKTIPPSAEVNLSMHDQEDVFTCKLQQKIRERLYAILFLQFHANTQRQMCCQAGTQAVPHKSHRKGSSLIHDACPNQCPSHLRQRHNFTIHQEDNECCHDHVWIWLNRLTHGLSTCCSPATCMCCG
jgi:hypothetical protein